MKFVAKEDITLSQQVFYDRMADFQMFERVADSARRRHYTTWITGLGRGIEMGLHV